MNRCPVIACVWFAVSTALTGLVSAQAAPDIPAPPNEERARALFIEARKLFDQGQVSEACERFAQSDSLVSTIASLLNLGLCHRQLGELLLARAFYRRAQTAALNEGDGTRAQAASVEATNLETRLATLTLLVMDRAQPGLELSIDNTLQPAQGWGSPVFVQAGEHEVVATGKGRDAWREHVTLAAGEQRIVSVPPLSEPTPSLPVEVAAPVRHELAPLAAATSTVRNVDSGPDLQRVVAVSLAAAGAVSAALAITFGVLAYSTDAKSEAQCNDDDRCTSRGIRLRELAATHATRADVAGIAGAAALAGAALLWFTAPDAPVRAGLSYQRDGIGMHMAVRL